ncbi:Glyoxylase, beta-lactamase superfamily II [Anaerovirgula multivorans]|uniref:Glyoxylase, beta-lactamase superfamily II n=1 Tax=Anaerovirgula multivorans TaxID=312168 RepID=A0A239E686_9FIRM|nr:MBL fold metallo-hydrolase [Anaerovirgula multivorans]SNS40225.1 Glyoxylase, beta-lactamase superfamily II [Anaerovirgula multivorans]
MELKKFIVGINETNTYIIYETNTLEAFVIDPGDEEKALMQYIDRNSLNLKAIILTHYHHDHIGAAEELKKKYNAPIYAHKKEIEGLKDPEINHSKHKTRKAISIVPDKILSDGDIIAVTDIFLEVIHTPGHTPGGMCLKVKDANIIFTGDTIFSDDLGRTDLVGGNEEILKKTIMNKVSKWSDETIIYPGHGEASVMKEMRRKNIPYLSLKGC